MMPGGDGLQNIGLQSLSGPSSDNIAAAVGVEAATLTGSIGLPTVPMVGLRIRAVSKPSRSFILPVEGPYLDPYPGTVILCNGNAMVR